MNTTIQKFTKSFCYISCAFWASFFFANCNGNQDNTSELQQKIDSLEAANAEKTEEIKDITEFMNIISDGLDSIAVQEEQLTGNGKGMEGRKMTKEMLKANLDAFAALLERQRMRISQLEDSLKNKGEGYANLRNIVTYLNQQLEEKNKTIATLKASLNNKNVDIQKLNTQVKSLTSSNEKLTEEINKQGEILVAQSNAINECYVKIGTKKDLQQAGVLSGGGLLSKKKLDVTNFSNAGFKKVDIRNYLEVNIPSKKIRILTAMPSSAYTITSDGSNSKLTITDPTLFWSVSNYLVIQTK